jgi:serine protease Do
VRELNDELRGQYQVPPGGKGLLIVEVDPAGPAAAENLRPGDLIVEVNQEQVATPADLAARIAKLKQEGKKSALLLVDRQGDLRFVALRFREG